MFLFLLTLAMASPHIAGPDLLTNRTLDVAYDAAQKKGTVVVFLSAKCPCSTSHHGHLQEMADQHPSFQFVGIHSNSDEALDFSKEKFKNVFKFPIIQDGNAKLADQFKAFKTPHAFILDREGKIVYRGGVSSSADCSRSDKFFLKDALEDLEANKPPRVAEARTLGCIITRAK